MGKSTDGEQVALGGTFDPIHDGHRALFERAFSRGDVTVGLTSDDLASETRKINREVRPYGERLREVSDELRSYAGRFGRCYQIMRLHTPTGIADAPRFDVLVVSPETEPAGRKINEIRLERGIEPLTVDVVDHVLAEDGGIISSTRIVAGEIDEHGTLLEAETEESPAGSG